MHVSLDEVIAAAERRAAELPSRRGAAADVELDALRADCARYFDRVPEPPVYLRQEDPARERAKALLDEGGELLARALSLWAEAMARALRAHLAALAHTANGRLGEAEAAWSEARALEDAAVRAQRLWSRPG